MKKNNYLRPKNSVKAIEKAKYEDYKHHCIRITSLCALAVLNDLWDVSNEDMHEWYDNYAKLIKSISWEVDDLNKIEKALIDECGIVFEESK